jgi:hypothetical protein
MLKEGWELYGNPVFDPSDSSPVQAMILREKAE